MIACLPKGRLGTSLGSSKSILASAVISPRTLAVATTTMNFDGGLGLSTGRRESLPVVLFPIFREFGLAMQPAVDSVYRLQQASLEFRVVAVTDMGVFKSIRPFGWGISHIRDEYNWSNPKTNWTEYVHTELDQVSSDFGCSTIVDMSEDGVSDESWLQLVKMSGMGPSLGNPTHMAGPVMYHYSWRGWLGSLSAGKTSHVVETSEGEWSMDVVKSPNSSMVFVGTPTHEDRELADIARLRGWNSVILTASHWTGNDKDQRRAIDSLLDGLSLDGAGVVSRRTIFDSDVMGYSATTFICRPSSRDLVTAERKALAYWSSRVS